jgi:hypothetical protein
MALARFRKLCLDANDPARLGTFWAAVLHREWRPYPHGEGGVFGPTERHTLWLNAVPERRTVKHRAHLDVYAESLDGLEALGARVLLPEGDDRHWTVLADPEGGEFCAFLRAEPPPERLHGLVVDCADPAAQASWWGHVYGADVIHHPEGYSTVTRVPDMPVETMDFVPVPEPKSVKNRLHWDVSVTSVGPLVDAGATILREPDGDIRWYVLADPEGNEFCAFAD